MAISSGVRAPRALIKIGGQSFEVLSATVSQEATKQSATMTVECALNEFPGGDKFFADLSDNTAEMTIDGVQLIEGEWDTCIINYDHTTVSLSGADTSAKLHEKKSSEKFTNQTREQIVETIAQRNGLSAQVVIATLMAGKLWQIDWAKLTDGVSDAAILHKLAELSGARWWVKTGTLYFQDKVTVQSTYEVRYQSGGLSEPSSGDFISMYISLNLQAEKDITVTVKSWHQKKKLTVSSSTTLNGSISGNLTYDYRTPGLEQDHADDLANNKANELARHRIQIDVRVVGDPLIDIGQGLQLIGTAFAQTLNMDRIYHSIDDHGYIMDITARTAGLEGV
jgi:hypothetical protein